ncbi:lipase family alpha/beta hydrolase [Corynebacterium qintianiae]|uniref:lipase family alpha/beta hydrolase n=1 Tax=Corynebacterium qintianiae TaxID=2709392 RepID=UPI0013EA1713|nr:alpha/beta fold hydrolase [Corynebacterium qintianiae]
MRLTHLALLGLYAAGAYIGVKSRPVLPFNDTDFAPEHPTPVLYVHGFTSATNTFTVNAEYLRSHGYWTWGYDYGTTERHSLAASIPVLHGFGDLNDLVQELGENVEKVKAATGADKVDIVAHSQGGLLTKLYIAGGGANNIRRVVAIGANFHGTDIGGLAERVIPFIQRRPGIAEAVASTSALQQLAGSPFLEEIADLPDTDPRVVYTSIYTPADRTVTPNSSSILDSIDGADVINIDLEKAYPGFAPVIHSLLPRDPNVAELTRWGLEREARSESD